MIYIKTPVPRCTIKKSIFTSKINSLVRGFLVVLVTFKLKFDTVQGKVTLCWCSHILNSNISLLHLQKASNGWEIKICVMWFDQNVDRKTFMAWIVL